MGKKRKNSGKSGLTPPTKTLTKMAGVPQPQAQHQQPFSQILQQAHDSYISPNVSFNGSPTQQHSNNMTFPVNPNSLVMHPFIPPYPQLPIIHSTPQPSASPPPIQHSTYQQQPSVPPDIHASLQMLFQNFTDMNRRFDFLDTFMKEKLSKLDVIDKLNDKFDKFEKELVEMKSEINEIKNIQNTHKEIIDHEEQHHHEVADRMQTLERRSFDLEHENDELRENLLKMQTHSMKYNLIFGGISDKNCETENTEIVLKHFLQTELEITGVEDIEFQNVHRLRTRKNGKPRNIIARFTNYRDHEKVRQAASKLKGKPELTISQQYPPEIGDRRRKLYPKLKEFQRQGKRATMVYDQLIVNGHPYVPRPRAEPPYPIHNPDHDHA